ncbi:MAG: response regulator [Lachnospiraceae bacterium]|nr:response regulator [Lachnospiraceae bacterium]MDO4510100.1 response regulator [Lachnospiraceae bacterium]
MKREEKIKEVSDCLIQNLIKEKKCLILVNNRTKQYECLESDEVFKTIIDESGSIDGLYNTLFLNNKNNGMEDKAGYKQFENLSVFQRDQYRANLSFVVNDKERMYELMQSRISDDEMAIFITEQSYLFDHSTIEKEKAYTIQEAYLFSMIVDLSDDSCINPNTTEVMSDRQDFMDIKYSDWRLMISNMFKEQDRILFLRASSPENIINTLETKSRFNIDLQMMNIQGDYIWSRLCFARMKNFSRENPRFLYTVYDISEDMNQLLRQEGITKAVEEQNEILQHLDQKKTQFFANMSHEFRAPINAIMGMSEVILCNSKESNIREYAGDIKNASKMLLHLVNDILDLSKIQAGKMEIVPVEYETEDLVRNVGNVIRLMVQDKSLAYEVNIAKDVPKRLFGDEIRIAQVLTNLLTNAVKYTDQGKVTLTLNAVKDLKGMDAIEYIVEDTGCGIKPEDMDKLFASYERVNLERNRRVEGTGLGMGIVTGLLEAMNSKLNVESQYGKGSRFSFVLAQNYVNTSPVPQNISSNKELELGDKLILVVDDVPLNLKVVEVLLKPFGANVELVNNGKDALEMMKQKKYDLILLDHMMPGMDGVETLKQAREISDYYKDAAIIAMTGNASVTARDEYLCMGFTDYLEKPILQDKMKEILRAYIG